MKVFPVHYFPSVSWFAAISLEKSVFLEQWQHYRKQEMHNRMLIQGPNGVQFLSIPVKRTGKNTPISESEISYAENWQKNHWKSLETAYRSSPYFEYYEDRIAPFFSGAEELLLQLDLEIIKVLCGILEIETEFKLTESYEDADQYEKDFREEFLGRSNSMPEWFQPKEYHQVFKQFDPNLSVLDLICNEGPNARGVLQASLVKSL